MLKIPHQKYLLKVNDASSSRARCWACLDSLSFFD